jgi:hypothetical protein
MLIFMLKAVLLLSQAAQSAGPAEYDPGLKLSGLLADSLLANTQGRYGLMCMDLEHRTSFVKSEGSFFDCGSLPLLPVACAVCYRALPVGFMLGYAPDSLIVSAWEGDEEAALTLASNLGRERINRWLETCSILATHASDSSGAVMPYVSTPWDCLMMLAWMDRMIPLSGIEGLGAVTVDPELLESLPAGSGELGLVSWDGAGFMAVFSTRLEDGRYLGMAMLADSMESEELAQRRFGMLLGRLLEGDPSLAE